MLKIIVLYDKKKSYINDMRDIGIISKDIWVYQVIGNDNQCHFLFRFLVILYLKYIKILRLLEINVNLMV